MLKLGGDNSKIGLWAVMNCFFSDVKGVHAIWTYLQQLNTVVPLQIFGPRMLARAWAESKLSAFKTYLESGLLEMPFISLMSAPPPMPTV